jgi:hypothetical protein
MIDVAVRIMPLRVPLAVAGVRIGKIPCRTRSATGAREQEQGGGTSRYSPTASLRKNARIWLRLTEAGVAFGDTHRDTY